METSSIAYIAISKMEAYGKMTFPTSRGLARVMTWTDLILWFFGFLVYFDCTSTQTLCEPLPFPLNLTSDLKVVLVLAGALVYG